MKRAQLFPLIPPFSAWAMTATPPRSFPAAIIWRMPSTGQKALVLPMHADGAGETRLTLTLPVLLAAREIALHIEGAEKRAVLDRALADGNAAIDMPVRAVFENSARPVGCIGRVRRRLLPPTSP